MLTKYVWVTCEPGWNHVKDADNIAEHDAPEHFSAHLSESLLVTLNTVFLFIPVLVRSADVQTLKNMKKLWKHHLLWSEGSWCQDLDKEGSGEVEDNQKNEDEEGVLQS